MFILLQPDFYTYGNHVLVAHAGVSSHVGVTRVWYSILLHVSKETT